MACPAYVQYYSLFRERVQPNYEGAEAVEEYVRQWKSLRGLIDESRYNRVLVQLEYQAGQAEVWRDAVTTWFFRASGIPDQKNRVDHYPGRYEAESMKLEGYTVRNVTPPEDASGGKAVSCPIAQCAASLKYDGAAGWYTLHVEYFDQPDGVSHYRLTINGQLIDEWAAAEVLRTNTLDSTSSTRRLITGVALRPGDEIRIEGKPDGHETAALDYIEVLR